MQLERFVEGGVALPGLPVPERVRVEAPTTEVAAALNELAETLYGTLGRRGVRHGDDDLCSDTFSGALTAVANGERLLPKGTRLS